MDPIAAASDPDPVSRHLRELEERLLSRVRQVAAEVDRRVRNVLGDDLDANRTPPGGDDARD
jgi:hypothetical protein